MENTKIEWAHDTFNCWIGCAHSLYQGDDGKQHAHPGCLRCYAEADMDKRRGRVEWGSNGTRSRTSDDYWRNPIKWNRQAEQAGKRRRVFCASLADVFEDWQGRIQNADGADLWIDRTGMRCADEGSKDFAFEKQPLTMTNLRRDLFALIDATPWLDWLLLTKRPHNVRRMWNDIDTRPAGELQMYRKNVWLLTSVSDQATADALVPELLRCRDLVPVLGLSAEPLLGPIDLTSIGSQRLDALAGWKPAHEGWPEGANTDCLDWVIGGGESGGGARPSHPDWFRGIRDQCVAAGVPYFFKQWGEFAPLGKTSGLDPDHYYPGRGNRVSVPSGIPMDEPTSMFRVGKKAAGRILDGRTWDQFPEAIL